MEHKKPLRFYFVRAMKPSVQRAAKTVETEEGRSFDEYLREPTCDAASNRAALGSKERNKHCHRHRKCRSREQNVIARGLGRGMVALLWGGHKISVIKMKEFKKSLGK